ncbi:ATP-binding protein [Paraburkholderia sp.]|uniref:sensor histidine kinase n=1 Tax=Paraburkholderia sp. TaxID=1926495 RepID=UPI00257C8656|nr:ATP-binding protein [Paraburkholderia sp.]
MALAVLACCATMAWLAYEIALGYYQRVRAAEVAQRASFYALSLESQLARYESLPRIAALEPVLLELLAHPGDSASRVDADAYLKAVQVNAQLAAAYVMDAHGVTLAASNWDEPGSFVGSNYAFRPYFIDAMKHGFGRFYGVGNTTGEPGYFLAVPIRDPAHPERPPVGAIAIKAPLDGYESALAKSGDVVLLADRDNVVFLTSVPAWRYRALAPLSDNALRGVRATRQYGDAALQALSTPPPHNPGAATGHLNLLADEGATPPRSLYVTPTGMRARWYGVQYRSVGPLGWKIAILVDPTDDRRTAALAAIGAAAASALFFSLLTAAWLRHSRERERHRARLALQNAQRNLEVRIVERTAELTRANAALAQKVDALDDARRILRDTRDTAIQAGKLAALGQMAAGITHELNQPLAALMTLSNNAVKLTGLDRLAELQRNLNLINELAARMGTIISHVKAFARYDAIGRGPVAIEETLRQALALIEPHRKAAGVTIRVEPVPDEAVVLASPIRIEQVLVNLFANAIDASAAAGLTREVVVTTGVAEGTVRIRVQDDGNGIPPHVAPRLFEPFYTTKTSGQGLGLGLAISQAIVDEFGGRLDGRNRRDLGDASPGAVFTVELPRIILEKPIR